jgi:hypothetical protein
MVAPIAVARRLLVAVATLTATTSALVGITAPAQALVLFPPNAYQLSLIAGRPFVATATPQQTDAPGAVAVDTDQDGDLFIADEHGYVEKVRPDGTFSIIAGNGKISGTPVPGPAVRSPMAPRDVAVDVSGNVYIADGLGYVEKVSTDGTLSIIGGRGSLSGALAPGKPATWSSLDPTSIDVDSVGNLFLTSNDNILKIAPDRTLTLLAGNVADPLANWSNAHTHTGYMGANGIAVADSGTIFISGYEHVYKLTPEGVLTNFAGNGLTNPSVGNWLVSAPATAGPVQPTSVAVDSAGNVFFTDHQYSRGGVDRVTPDGTLSAVVGIGDSTPAQSQRNLLTAGVGTDASGNVFVADEAGSIGKVTPAGDYSRVVGTTTPATPRPGAATLSPLAPRDLAYGSDGTLYIADGAYVEKVTNGNLSVIAGNGNSDMDTLPVPGTATSSPLNARSIAVDGAGNVFVSTYRSVVKITPGGVLSIVAGAGAPSAGTPHPLAIEGIALDTQGNLYIAEDGYIDRMSADGAITIVAGHGSTDTLNNPTTGPALDVALIPTDVAADGSGSVYIAEYGTGNYKLSGGSITRFAGGASGNDPVPGPALSSHMAPVAVHAGPDGSVYVVDYVHIGLSNTGTYVEKVTPDSTLSVIAGNGDINSAPVLGWARSSPLQPASVAVSPAGDVAVADQAHGYVAGLTAHPTTVPSAPTNPSASPGSSSAAV